MGQARGPERFLATVLFTDIVGSTELATELGDRGWRDLLEAHHQLVRSVLSKYRGREIDTAGDGFFAAFDSPTLGVACATEIAREVQQHGLQIRAGLHIGEVEQIGKKIGGIAVHIGARVAATAGPGEVRVTSGVRDLSAGSGFRFNDEGMQALKGVPGEWHLFAVAPPDAERPVSLSQADNIVRRAAAVRRIQARPFWQLRPRLTALVAIGVVLIVIAATLVVWGPWRPSILDGVAENTVGVVDPKRGAIVAEIGVGGQPDGVAVGEGALWVANSADDTVSRIDLGLMNVVDTIEVGLKPSGITVGNGSVWVANSGDGTVSRINAASGKVVDTIPVGSGPTGIAADDGAVWVANVSNASVTRIDANSGVPGDPIGVGSAPIAVAAGNGEVWVVLADGAVATRLDPQTGAPLAAVPVGNSPAAVAIGEDAVWVANEGDATVSRIDPSGNRVVGVIDVGGSPQGIGVGSGSVWVAAGLQGDVVRIDPVAQGGSIAERIDAGSAPQRVVASGDQVFFSARAAAVKHRGGTLTVVSEDLPVLDPSVGYFGLTPLSLTVDGLVGFPRVGGVEGASLVADLATTLPQAIDNGTTYAFRLRRGIKYSSGEPVLASDFLRGIERIFQIADPDFGGPSAGVGFFEGLVGAERCAKAAPVPRCDLSEGIEVDDDAGSVTFHLATADPEFLYKLTFPFASPLPAGVAPDTEKATAPLPAVGPYMVSSISDKEVQLVRNPEFRSWSPEARPDGFVYEIVLKSGIGRDRQVDMVAEGEADWMADLVPVDRVQEVRARFTPQLHQSFAGTTFVSMDVTRPPFDRVEARRALNLAIDRSRVTEFYGGANEVVVTCQILPPNFPGYHPFCPYTRGGNPAGVWEAPDLAEAKRLVAESGTAGAKVTVGPVPPRHNPLARYLTSVLQKLGYSVSTKLTNDIQVAFNAINSGNVQVEAAEWFPDYPAASGFFTPLFTCEGYFNIAHVCDENLDREVREATELQSTGSPGASERWAAIDREVTNQAYWAPLVNALHLDFVSERVGNYQFHPQWGILLDQVWVR